MTDFWNNILKPYSVDKFADFSNSNYLMPLTQLGVLQVSGEDAKSFLQNLLTNDVNALAINEAQLSGFCNAKGRLFATFLLIRRADEFLLVLPQSMCLTLEQRLNMFKLRSKVSITNLTESQMALGLNRHSDSLSSFLDFPVENYTAAEFKNSLIIKLPSSEHRYLAIGDSGNITELCQALHPESWHVADEPSWKLLDIEAGHSTIVSETKEKFTPQQINFDLIGGVSFKKGCYPGQEVVARLHYLGNPSRRLFYAEYVGEHSADPGQEVTDQDGNILGYIVAAEFSSPKNIKLLLSLKLSNKDKAMFLDTKTSIKNIKELANN